MKNIDDEDKFKRKGRLEYIFVHQLISFNMISNNMQFYYQIEI